MKSISCFLSSLFFIFWILALHGCANIIPPTGGPRDSIPPALVNANPQNLSRNFTSKRIELNFDEFLELKETQQNITVSPVPKSEPLIESKLRTITIKWRDTLEPNTTYSVDFGKSIRDVNEGNTLRNFSYTFSTGKYIDSMEFSGKIIVAATGKVDSSLIAMLYTKMDDSAVIKDKPRYITHSDTAGHFLFRHLKPGTYRLFALKDESGSKKYISKTQLFAFADEPVEVGAKSNPVTLYAYSDTTSTPTTTTSTKKSSRPGVGGAAAAPKKEEKEKVKRLIFSTNLTNGQADLLSKLEIQFPVPLKFYDSTRVRFTDDKFQAIAPYRFELDSAKKKLVLLYTWKNDTKYNIILDKEFAQDTLGNKLLKSDTLAFKSKGEADYGSLRIRFTNLPLDRNPVLLFLQADVLKYSRPLTSNTFFDRLFVPGDYDLRILFDDNKNGVWDPGEFFIKHRQPEKVLNLRGKLTVRANWDNQPSYIL